MKVCGGGYGACWAIGDGDPGLTIPLGISEEEDDCKQNEKTARNSAKLTNTHKYTHTRTFYTGKTIYCKLGNSAVKKFSSITFNDENSELQK